MPDQGPSTDGMQEKGHSVWERYSHRSLVAWIRCWRCIWGYHSDSRNRSASVVVVVAVAVPSCSYCSNWDLSRCQSFSHAGTDAASAEGGHTAAASPESYPGSPPSIWVVPLCRSLAEGGAHRSMPTVASRPCQRNPSAERRGILVLWCLVTEV